MATCATMGQAAGTAAPCARHDLTPRQLVADSTRLDELQQTLLRDDQTIKNLGNIDPRDLAWLATVTALGTHGTSQTENVGDGFVRDMEGDMNHRWLAALSPGEPAWIELTWPDPKTIRHVQITFDTGFHRELTLTSSDAHNRQIIRAPQPETVRDYTLSARLANGSTVSLAQITENHQRLRRHDFRPRPRPVAPPRSSGHQRLGTRPRL